MSSNIQIKRVCEHCQKVFTARTTVTRFCSDECAKRNYKLRKKNAAILTSNAETKAQIVSPAKNSGIQSSSTDQAEFINIKVLSAITSIGERTLYRIIKTDGFPRLKIGGRLVFHKQTVIKYLIDQFGNL